MANSTEVFKKIKEMSGSTLNPCHPILLNHIAAALSIRPDSLLVLLIELHDKGLIKINHTAVTTISLTNYGAANDALSGSFNSEEL